MDFKKREIYIFTYTYQNGRCPSESVRGRDTCRIPAPSVKVTASSVPRLTFRSSVKFVSIFQRPFVSHSSQETLRSAVGFNMNLNIPIKWIHLWRITLFFSLLTLHGVFSSAKHDVHVLHNLFNTHLSHDFFYQLVNFKVFWISTSLTGGPVIYSVL